MQNKSGTRRRVQNSSCDECRRCRVACDAARTRTQHGSRGALSACTRCTKRARECTFEWMKATNRSTNARRTYAHAGSDHLSRPSEDSSSNHEATNTNGETIERVSHERTATTVPFRRLENTASESEELMTPPTDRSAYLENEANVSPWLNAIYSAGFETIFGSWMGKFSNPFFFGEQNSMELCVSIRSLCAQLDDWISHDTQNTSVFGTPQHPCVSSSDSIFEQSIQHAVEAYAARWLPLVDTNGAQDRICSTVVQRLWRRARRGMLQAINRPSYRSMLALLLFALTPIPTGISDEEELDGVSGQVCVHAALQHIQTLRARQRSLSFNGARVVLASPKRATSTSPASYSPEDFINAESTAYWAALTFDTSASLTLSCRPLLSSGLFGYESETCWRMVRACAKVFREMTIQWNVVGLDLTDEKANQVVAAGSTWKLLLWKLTANFKQSLRDGHTDFEVRKAFHDVSEAIDEFDIVYKPLLNACYNRIHFFAQETKFRWYELTLHYHLCILMLADIAQATEREDLLREFSTKQSDAESWVLNCLKFGLTNRYTIRRENASLSTEEAASINGDQASVTVCFIAIDPYAHHVVAAVKLMHQAIDRDFESGKLNADAYRDLLSILTETLGYLPQGSKSVQIARASVSSQPLYR